MEATADEDFQRYLDVLKEHYGHTMEFNMAKKGKLQTTASTSAGPSSEDVPLVASETTVASKQSTEDSHGK